MEPGVKFDTFQFQAVVRVWLFDLLGFDQPKLRLNFSDSGRFEFSNVDNRELEHEFATKIAQHGNVLLWFSSPERASPAYVTVKDSELDSVLAPISPQLPATIRQQISAEAIFSIVRIITTGLDAAAVFVLSWDDYFSAFLERFYFTDGYFDKTGLFEKYAAMHNTRKIGQFEAIMEAMNIDHIGRYRKFILPQHLDQRELVLSDMNQLPVQYQPRSNFLKLFIGEQNIEEKDSIFVEYCWIKFINQMVGNINMTSLEKVMADYQVQQ